MKKNIFLLAIETSCDDTSVAIMCNNEVLSNVTATQKVHENWGGVVPELASRDHVKHIIPVVAESLKVAKIDLSQLDAIAYTNGPGLIGSLLVGAMFGKSMAQCLRVPAIEVHHMKAHIMAHLIGDSTPSFPFLCLTVSGGHTQLVKVNDPLAFELLGQTIDDAAGEAFDKGAKILGLPYPGGPLIDKYAQTGNPHAFVFPTSNIEGTNFSFSGLKTALLYWVNKQSKAFIDLHINDICASYQHSILTQLLNKLETVAVAHKITSIAIAGGVSANSELRKRIKNMESNGYKTYIPILQYCTDNAAMIGITAYYQYLINDFATTSSCPSPRLNW